MTGRSPSTRRRPRTRTARAGEFFFFKLVVVFFFCSVLVFFSPFPLAKRSSLPHFPPSFSF